MSGGTGPLWLVIEDIMELHTLMIARFGGREGVRDIRLVVLFPDLNRTRASS